MADPTPPAPDAAAAAGAAAQDGRAAAAAAPDDAFVRHASLVYAVPLATDDRLVQALQQCAQTGGAPRPLIEGLEQRESLFFDETADVYLIVRTPFLPADRLAAYGSRLTLALEAHIVNSAAASGRSGGSGGSGTGPAPVVEAIYSGRVDAGTAPLVAVSDPAPAENDSDSESEHDSDNDNDSDNDSETENTSETPPVPRRKRPPPRHSYLVWKLPVFLRRPRARLHGPSVSFSATATLLPAAAAASVPATAAATPASADQAGYLRSREPSGLNLLAAFTGDPALVPDSTGEHTDDNDSSAVVWPRLSAQRVARVAPAGTRGGGSGDNYGANDDGDDNNDETGRRRRQPRPLRVPQKTLSFPIAPAVHTRVRFARANHGATAAPTDAAVVALLEVDFTPFFDCEAVLTHIALTLPGGRVTDLNTGGDDRGSGGLGLPVYCVARDHLTFLYRLTPDEHGGPTSSSIAAPRDVAIALEACVRVRPGVCAPRLRLAWTAALDFAPPVNPAFGAALLPPAPLQRAHRPSQLSIDGMSSFAAPAVSRPDALPSLEGTSSTKGPGGGLSVETALPDFGITVTLTAPAQPVYAGEPFRWSVLVVNRAGADASGAASSSSTAPGRRLALLVLPKRRRNDVRVLRPPSASASTTTPPVADAVLDDNIVHAMQSSSLVDRTDVVCLSSADDTRIGPLAPGACHAAALRFVALRAGVVAVDAVRVVDLGSQEHVDVRALPAMVIAEGRRP